ncbi:MAG TPA: ABC-F family ATP-binding cassette domain-containing protein, partial [Mycobacteriales bacterium]|nr:ABC-F family ATP-binding cassette domain-containing protein [Mycobacteriales bacterium]
SLGVQAGERTGVVGRNGGGKTTLLRLLTGRETPDSGRVSSAGGLRLGYVDQRSEPPGGTVRDAVLSGYGEVHEWAGDAAVRAVLDGLGLNRIGLDAPTAELSGGERRRTALAGALVARSDLLILDEPTNHLDVEGVAWLADHLKSRREALVVVTHDRWFLDEVAEQTWEIGDGTVRRYDGGYSAYVLARAERARQAAASEQRRQNLLRKELAWLRRGPPARTSKPRFRIEAAQALIADEPPPRDRTRLQAFATRRLGRSVYDVEDVTLKVGGRTLLDGVTWRLGPGDRVAIVGVNGSGKTTLLRLLLGELAPDAGRVRTGPTVRAAYLSQEVQELPAELRLLESVEQVARTASLGGVELTASQLAERFGFGASRQWTPVADLSGGERRRLQLLRLLMAEPNVLLLDEPTNDLDTDTLTALEDVLDSWPGTLVVVSHDRYLVERVSDSVVALLGDGRLAALPGGVEDYLARRAAAVAPAAAEAARQRAGDTRAEARAARRELTRLERRIATLEKREAELHRQLAEHATDHVRVTELDGELRAVGADRDAAESAWLELAESAGDG